MPETDLNAHSEDVLQSALDGLRRLAFGPVNDAVRLIAHLDDLGADELSGLNLFCISEIRQAKEGCIEIKFYDRLKACELLSVLGRERENNPAASSFYGALESAAKSACDADAL